MSSGMPPDDLDLVVLAHAREEPTASSRGSSSRLTGRFSATMARIDLLDACEIVGREALGPLEVVVEAVLDHRADRDLGAREEALDRLRHQVRARVAQHLEPLRRVGRHGASRQSLVERTAQVDDARGVARARRAPRPRAAPPCVRLRCARRAAGAHRRRWSRRADAPAPRRRRSRRSRPSGTTHGDWTAAGLGANVGSRHGRD